MPPISEHLIAELLQNCRSPNDIFGEQGIIKQVEKQIIDYSIKHKICASLDNIDEHNFSDYALSASVSGLSPKQMKDLQNQIVLLYAQGSSYLDIQTFIQKSYDIQVSQYLMNKSIEMATAHFELWKNRMLNPIYPIVYLDGIWVNSKENGMVKQKVVYVALGINMQGRKEVLGLWIANGEGAKFWAGVLSELKNRGLNDILIMCFDGLKGLPESVRAVYAETRIQMCMLHQKRNSLKQVKRVDYGKAAHDLSNIYHAPTLEFAEKLLDEAEKTWQASYPSLVRSWRRNWHHLIEFYTYPPAIRRVLYTTNMIESLNASFRKIAYDKRCFANDAAVLKAFYLNLGVVSQRWTAPIQNWKAALNYFNLMFEDRIPL